MQPASQIILILTNEIHYKEPAHLPVLHFGWWFSSNICTTAIFFGCIFTQQLFDVSSKMRTNKCDLINASRRKEHVLINTICDMDTMEKLHVHSLPESVDEEKKNKRKSERASEKKSTQSARHFLLSASLTLSIIHVYLNKTKRISSFVFGSDVEYNLSLG